MNINEYPWRAWILSNNTKAGGHWPFGSKEEKIARVLPYMAVETIL